MEQITSSLGNITLESESRSTYEQVFGKLVLFAEKARGDLIPPNELAVTKTLAKPFSQGGLLILLLEPRPYHPWDRGVDAVISDCKTLGSLAEGVQIGSKGTLSLINDVSVIDLRPFLVKEHHVLGDDKWEELYDLVFSAVKAKWPDVLLCMGTEAMNALKKRKNTLRADFRQRMQLVCAMHPGYSVNHNSNDLHIRNQLLKSICEACNKLVGGWDENSWEERYTNRNLYAPSVVSTPGSRSRQFTDKKCVESFLNIIMILCFRPGHRLPALATVPGPYYHLEDWHKKWFSRMRGYPEAKDSSKNHARMLIIPVFEQLNRSFQKTSWFLPTYEMNCVGVRLALIGLTLEFEHACYLLAGDWKRDMDCKPDDTLLYEDGNDTLAHLLTRMEKITSRATRLWQNRHCHPPRNISYFDPYIEVSRVDVNAV
jgi:hypothetical protein